VGVPEANGVNGIEDALVSVLVLGWTATRGFAYEVTYALRSFNCVITNIFGAAFVKAR
jgi:hypothetical protein